MSLGFQPDIVIIKADNAATEGIIRTSTMATGSRPIWNGSVLLANNITSLDANGFTVGSDIRVNGLNVCGGGGAPCEYYWTAFKADANIVVDTYSGDGVATQAIMGVGFAVDYVMIYGDGNKWPRNRTSFPSTTALGAGANFRIRNAGENSTSIPSLDANGFTVGNGNGDQEDANSSGVTYHYIAFNESGGQIKVGSYSGDGANPRDVNGVGFQPAYVLVQSLDDGDQAYQKSDQMPAAQSLDFLENLIVNRIVGLIPDGFQVSSDARVNSSGEDYTYIAFASGGGASNLTAGHYRCWNDDGLEGSGAQPIQATAITDDTTTSTTDVALAGMSITPGAGDYIAWFSGSVENSSGTDDQLPWCTTRDLGPQLSCTHGSRFPMSIFKRTQRKYVKKAYRVRNWREYEAGLRNRGSLTVWSSLTAGKLVNWDAPRPRRRKPGRQRKYSNHAIETAVTLGMVFHLSSRQSEGLLRSLFALMKLDNDVPDHTTISRRKAKLGKVPFYQDKQKTPLHILIDSSGLAVHAGQLRRAPKSRDYRKLHLCVDEQTGEVVAGELTSKRARDSSRVASLVGQIDSPISSARADTAYDASGVYEAIENHSAHRSPRVLIPPRKGAQLASGPASSRQRNRNIAAQARLGKRKWHTESGYSKRSKVETTFHRYKAIVGSAMRARGLAAQRVEARIGCKILNTMTALGMPDSEMIG